MGARSSFASNASAVRIRDAPAEPATATGALRHAQGTAQIRRTGWWLTFAFCGQAFSYYSITAWLPTLLADTRGLSLAASGAGASLFQVAAIAGALGTPVLAARTPAWVHSVTAIPAAANASSSAERTRPRPPTKPQERSGRRCGVCNSN